MLLMKGQQISQYSILLNLWCFRWLCCFAMHVFLRRTPEAERKRPWSFKISQGHNFDQQTLVHIWKLKPSSAFICVERPTTTFRKATKESFLDANGSLGWERRGCPNCPIGNSKFHSSRTHPMPNHFFSGCLMKGGLYLDHHSGWYFGLNRESGLFHNRADK